MAAREEKPFLKRLSKIARLSEADMAALEGMPLVLRTFAADQDVVVEGERPHNCFAILEGLMCCYKLTGNGGRQIPAFYVAGDIPDLHSLHLKVIDTSVRTVAPCTLAFVEHETLHALCQKSYAIASALWRVTLIDGSIFREWETNIGRREAAARMAHVMCEAYLRLQAVGLVEGLSFLFPITQQQLGDALGISTVHVNRTLQSLRREGLLRFESGRVEILDWPAMKVRGDFDPGYLHQDLSDWVPSR
jgi:CRP-like cAMP-binding protein